MSSSANIILKMTLAKVNGNGKDNFLIKKKIKGEIMEKHIIEVNEISVAVIHSDEPIITDTQSALDFMATIRFDDNCERIVINKEAIIEDFFKLSTGIAGEIIQKFVNYSQKIAVVGDFSIYKSKPLRDFIYECNQGNAIFFVPDKQTAIDKLTMV